MTIKVSTSLNIPFHDIDILNIAWHGHYYKYFEIARTRLMQKLKLDWPVLKSMGYALPIIHSECKYRIPLSYDQKINISAEIREFDQPSLDIYYVISSEKEDIHAQGKTRQAYLTIESKEICFSAPKEVLTSFQNFLSKEEV